MNPKPNVNVDSIDKDLEVMQGKLSTKLGDFETLKTEVEKLQGVIGALQQLKAYYASLQRPHSPISPPKSVLAQEARHEVVPVVSNSAPISSAVLAALREAKKPVRMSDLDKHLRRQGMKLSRNSTWMALQRLESKKLIWKLNRGLYQVVNGSG